MIDSNSGVETSPLPDTIRSGGFTFLKEWVYPLDKIIPGWKAADWTFAGNQCEFTPATIRFQNGIMHLTIKKKQSPVLGKYPDRPYWGAEYYSTAAFSYGRFLVRMKPNSPPGVVTSFFLYSAGWEDNHYEMNEIDIEFPGRTNEVQFTLHWIDQEGERHSNTTVQKLPFPAGNNFHLWEIEKTPKEISFLLDGEILHTFSDSIQIWEQGHPQAIHMNYWISRYPDWVGRFDPNGLPVEAEYDFIGYYRLLRKFPRP